MKLLLLLLLTTSLTAKTITPDSSTVRSMGRVEWTTGGARYDWCGTRFDFSFTGTSLALSFDDVQNRYDITIDGESYPTITTPWYDTTVEITTALEDGVHHVTLERRTEQTWGITTFKEILLNDTGSLLPAPSRPEKRLLILGDSYTAGYGTEHDSREGTTDTYISTSNTAKAFGSLVGKHYESDYTTLGFSGKGLVRNANGDSPGKEYPQYYDNLFASDINLGLEIYRPWNHASWKPQIVVVHLGINDFTGTEVAPADTNEWVQVYGELLDTLNSQFPGVATVVCATYVWPNDYLYSSADRVVAAAKSKGYRVHKYEYSINAEALDYHPSVAENQTIANGLIALIDREDLWNGSATAIAHSSHRSAGVTVAGNRVQFDREITGEIALYSLSGKELWKQEISSTEMVLPTTDFGAGVMLLRVHAPGVSFLQKIVP